MTANPRASTDHHARVAALFAAALELSASARVTFLEAECGSSPALREEVTALLHTHETGGDFLQALDPVGLVGMLEGVGTGPGTGARVGPYRIVRELGRGGMGTVHLAERADGQFERQVALKVVRGGLAPAQLAGRFLRERQILAHLEHPNIARLLDGGVTEEGSPWLAMEYVEGQPITTFCDERGLDVEARLELFEDVCAAVQYAHRRLIVHRDLKPANILVSSAGVKLLDFGIAKLLDPEPVDAAAVTVGLRVMTPEYAAPEQLRGETVTTAADVYALGALLYELLSGHRAHGIRRGSIEEMARVLTRDVIPPSVVAARSVEAVDGPSADAPDLPALSAETIAAARATTPGGLRRLLQGDLDAIVLTALRSEPEHRYRSPEALREDVRRHRDGFTVLAHPVTAVHRLGRLVRRHRPAASAAVVALVAVLAGVAGTAWQGREAARERDAALQEADKATRIYNLTAELFQLADPARARAGEVTLREVLDTGRVWIARELVGQPELRADMDVVLGEVYYSLGLFEPALGLFEDAVAARVTALGEDHESVSIALLKVGQVHESLGNTDSAEIVARRGLGLIERLPPFEDKAFVMTHALVRLGEALRRQGRLAQAEDTIRLALGILPEHADAENRRTVLLTLLGHVLRAQGNPAGAEDAHREVLETRRRLRGDEDSEVANATINLASAIVDQGRWEEGAALYREGLALRRRVQGEGHVEYATDLAVFADMLRLRPAPAEALPAFEEALPILRRAFPADHPFVVRALLGLSATLLDLDRAEEAEPYLREATAATDSMATRFGPDSPDVREFRQTLQRLRVR